MGVSTDGILFYGYIWTDEDDCYPEALNGESINGWAEIEARKRGIVNPYDTIPEAINYHMAPQAEQDAWYDANGELVSAWFKAVSEIKEKSLCDVGWHCSDECSMPYVYVKSTEIMASRGYPEALDLQSMALLTPGGTSLLESFLNALGIEPPEGQQPGWWLTSYWG